MKNRIIVQRRKHLFLVHFISFLFVFVNFSQASENESAYSINVSIPAYDSNNSEHFLIASSSDWSHINDSDKRYFYVEPSLDYGTVTITANGTESEKRYISLYNGNDAHPAKLDVTEQANVKLIFKDAHYWIVDRISGIDNSTVDEVCFIAKSHSSHIVFNRLYLTNFYNGILIQGTMESPFTTNITVQNSRLDPMSAKGIDDDRVAIILTGEDWNISRVLANTKILNNEIRNCNDGIQPVTRTEISGFTVDYPGTIIDCNHIYADSDVYTDGKGNHDPNGLYAWTENAIDLKGGSNDPDNPMIISNNYLWGWKKTDKNGGGSGCWGDALGGHYHVKNIIIENNVVFDSNRGIDFADPGGLPYSIENGVVTGNIIYNIGDSPSGDIEFANFFYKSKNLNFSDNTIVGVNKKSRWFANNYDEEDMIVSNNVIINSYAMTGTRTSTTNIESNYFYNTALQNFNDGVFYENAKDANMTDLTFITDTYTNNPREITLQGVVSTDLSPHTIENSNSADDGSMWSNDFELVEIKSNLDKHLQKAYFYSSKSDKPRPLVVSLHTWSGDYSQNDDIAQMCKSRDLNYIHPNFRGKNSTKNACCSELALDDIDESISYAIENANIDKSNIFVIGFSGGGYATLSTFMKSKYSIKKFSAWGSITDLIS